ncbi:MAG: phage tail protein [Acidobacteriota bacterium]|nr:phage tail protein [Acidobacteriota bacterium]
MANTEFPVNSYRYDPYQNWRFRVKWDGKTVAGISKVSALTRTTQVVTQRTGDDPGVIRRAPGQSEYGAITLERGVTHDKDFEQWANKIWDFTNSRANPAEQIVSLADFRKDISIELMNEAGQLVMAYNIYRCWVSEFQAQADLDGTGNAVLIQNIKLENEGWERDYTVAEPTQPSFLLPA